MKAALLTGPGQLEIRDVPAPRLENPADVLLRVEAVGVCGSDIHYYVNGRIGSRMVKYPFAVGHEFAATVLDTGSACTRLRPGDRVTVDPAISCGDCDQCRQGREHTCRNLRFSGCPGEKEGCLGEFYTMPEKCCFPIAADTDFALAALMEPFTIGVYAAQLAGDLRGRRIGILGAGPIGMCVMAAARGMGVDAVYVSEPIAGRRELAGQHGADWTGDPHNEDVVAAIVDREPLLLDAVFECCGEQSALDQGVELLKPGGTLLLIGIPAYERVSFEIDLLRRKELCLQNVRRQNACSQRAIDLIEKQGLDIGWMITHRFDLEDTKAAFDLVHAYADGVVKAMIHVGDRG